MGQYNTADFPHHNFILKIPANSVLIIKKGTADNTERKKSNWQYYNKIKNKDENKNNS